MALNKDQIRRLRVLETENFRWATSTRTHPVKAERAVAVIMRAYMSTYQVHWVPDPGKGQGLYEELGALIVSPLHRGMGLTWLQQLREDLWDDFNDRLIDSVMNPRVLADTPSVRQKTSLEDIRGIIAGFYDHYPVYSDFSLVLAETYFNSLTWNHAFYTFCLELPGISFASTLARRVKAMTALSKSAFALWILPGHAIICMKPVTVQKVRGKVSDMTFAEELSPELQGESAVEEPEISVLDRILLGD